MCSGNDLPKFRIDILPPSSGPRCEEGGRKFFRNVGRFIPICTALLSPGHWRLLWILLLFVLSSLNRWRCPSILSNGGCMNINNCDFTWRRSPCGFLRDTVGGRHFGTITPPTACQTRNLESAATPLRTSCLAPCLRPVNDRCQQWRAVVTLREYVTVGSYSYSYVTGYCVVICANRILLRISVCS